MKKKYIHMLCLLVILILMVVVLIESKKGNTPPSIETIHNCFQEHCTDIDIVTDYLSSLHFEDVYITDNSGTMLADINRIPIDEQIVSDAIGRIIGGQAYKHINKDGNTISLLQWTGIRDIGCGIAYSINGIDAPEIEFATQLTPLSDDGWFYYVSDYDAWRNKQ